MTYDPENVFGKILEAKLPSNTIFENRYVIAILDKYPITPGHTVVIPKKTGYTDLLQMPPRDVNFQKNP